MINSHDAVIAFLREMGSTTADAAPRGLLRDTNRPVLTFVEGGKIIMDRRSLPVLPVTCPS